MSVRTPHASSLLLAIFVAACSSNGTNTGPQFTGGAGIQDAGADGAAEGDASGSNDSGGATSDSVSGGDDTTGGPSDMAGAPDAGDDAGSNDAGSNDAGSDDAGAGGNDGATTPDAGPAAPTCAECPWDGTPASTHPGAPGPYPLADAIDTVYGSGGGLLGNHRRLRIIKPVEPGPWPVLFFVHGKSLYEGFKPGGGTQLGLPYNKMLEHVASHGYVAVFVRVEEGLLDADTDRQAEDFLKATQSVFSQESAADESQVVFAGHSMGAKVVLHALYKTLKEDDANLSVNPAAVIAMAVSNEAPPVGKFVDIVPSMAAIDAIEPVRVTFLQAHDDAIAPYLDPNKPNAVALYDALQIKHKQIVVLHGTGKNDPNPETTPELHDDHAFCLSIEGKPGGLADAIMPASYLDALDTYGVWKTLVGAMDYHFKGGHESWAYGELRSHGGTLPNGTIITHEVFKQGW